jgi:RNA polymerase sigma-70 factor (sigma-E family)
VADRDELLADLYARHHGEAVRLAWALCRDAVLAEELAQEAFVRLYVRRRTLRDPAAAPAYLRRTIVNLVHDHGRRSGRQRELVVPMSAATEEPIDALDPIGARTLVDAVAELPKRRRACVILRYYLDLSEADTAAALGVSVGTVKSQTHKALAQLREVLGDPSEPAASGADPTAGGPP